MYTTVVKGNEQNKEREKEERRKKETDRKRKKGGRGKERDRERETERERGRRVDFRANVGACKHEPQFRRRGPADPFRPCIPSASAFDCASGRAAVS